MLNCTDLACVLHHHHFYAHLHHLKHHLSEDHLEQSHSGNLSEYQIEVYSKQVGLFSGKHHESTGIINNTKIEPDHSSSAHLDAPNEVLVMICGMVIALLLVGLIIALIAVTINKIRKREDSLTPLQNRITDSVPPNESFLAPAVVYQHHQPNVWVFPPAPACNKHSSPIAIAEVSLQQKNSSLNDTKVNLTKIVRNLSLEKEKTLVSTIPPELKSQLKSIYVY